MQRLPVGFRYAKEYEGIFISLNHKDIKEFWERRYPDEPFTGACAGSVCALIDVLVQSINANPIYGIPPVSKLACAIHQWNYERGHDEYMNILIRNKLGSEGIHITFPQENYCNEPRDLLAQIENDFGGNQILLANLVFKFHSSGRNIRQDHMMCIIKFNSSYIFFDPNIGIAVFKNHASFEQWFNREIQDGALAFFTKPIPKTILIHSNKIGEHGKAMKGELLVDTVKTDNYVFNMPAPKFAPPRAKF